MCMLKLKMNYMKWLYDAKKVANGCYQSVFAFPAKGIVQIKLKFHLFSTHRCVNEVSGDIF